MEDIEQPKRPYRSTKGVEGSNVAFLKRVGSYEWSMSYDRYGSCCALKSGIIERNGDMQSEMLESLESGLRGLIEPFALF